MALDDKVFEKVEKKTKVSKGKILELATKLQQNSLRDEATLRDVIRELSSMTGKKVSKEKEDKIVDTIIKDKVPKNVEKMF